MTNARPSIVVSVALHAAAMVMLCVLFPPPRYWTKPQESVVAVSLVAGKRVEFDGVPQKRKSGGGGGGTREKNPTSRGRLPRPSLKQFVAPRTESSPDAKWTMEPTVLANTPLPSSDLPHYGDPREFARLLSDGGGTGGSIGPGRGPGVGDGYGGGYGGGAFQLGGGRGSEYGGPPNPPPDGGNRKVHGKIDFSFTIDDKGTPQDIRVVRSLGPDIDRRTIEAFRATSFPVSMREGKPADYRFVSTYYFRLE